MWRIFNVQFINSFDAMLSPKWFNAFLWKVLWFISFHHADLFSDVRKRDITFEEMNVLKSPKAKYETINENLYPVLPLLSISTLISHALEFRVALKNKEFFPLLRLDESQEEIFLSELLRMTISQCVFIGLVLWQRCAPYYVFHCFARIIWVHISYFLSSSIFYLLVIEPLVHWLTSLSVFC